MKYHDLLNNFIKLSNEKEYEIFLLRKELGYRSYENLLDVGGGTGILTKPFISQFNHIDVVEPNPEFRQYYNNLNINLYQTKIETYFVNKKYNIIIASHVFPYIKLKDWNFVLQKLINMVAKNGKLIIFEMTKDGILGDIKKIAYGKSVNSAYDTLIPFIKELKYDVHERLFKPKFSISKEKEIMLVLEFFAEKELCGFKERESKVQSYIKHNIFDKDKNNYILSLCNKMTVISL